MRFALLFFTAALLVLGCLDSGPSAKDTPWETYDAGSFSIDYPSNWKSEATPTGVIFSSNNQGANLQAAYYPLEADIPDLETYVTENKKFLTLEELNKLSTEENQLENAEILSETDRTINGVPARKLQIRTKLKIGLVVRQEQIYLVQGKTGFVMTATAADAGFQAEKALFEKAFESFRIK